MDEFSFLAAQAAEIGVAVPPVRRLNHTLADGRVVSALEYGDAATGAFGAPVVTLLHGAGLNAHTWDTTILALGLPALSLDLPGHGDSSWRDDAAYVGRTLAADIADPITAWTDASQVLVGQSLGGLTAAALAASHPELVRALVIVDITPGIDPDGDAAQIGAFFAGPTDWASRDELVDRALAFGLGGTREAATRGVFLNSRVREDGRVEWKHHFAHLANALAADPAAAGAAQQQRSAVRGALSASGWDDLAAVTAPITLVRGDRGFVTTADADLFRDRVPDATLVEVSSGHNVQEEQPVALAALVADIAR
ncbi:MAG: hydrolase [Microbacterium sp. SCN 70-200]|uniref:alpha/beta fold hydrolase n=1 Tax=unclassified Microbacterium TaxID=2609290 RepID=UPI0008689948|nr:MULTISPECIES: alpha/beta hydrolase [unclassified Microbacterium]MBN9213932.1 alpha/beta hydrolase [Microbacterium sp.]ODT42470.1 MAG: hydrolase [Microbacterium sp. SCN 70-200]OJV85401.1 MAG: alpha/beta hydrolase [Microbacterium sp. 70-16]